MPFINVEQAGWMQRMQKAPAQMDIQLTKRAEQGSGGSGRLSCVTSCQALKVTTQGPWRSESAPGGSSAAWRMGKPKVNKAAARKLARGGVLHTHPLPALRQPGSAALRPAAAPTHSTAARTSR